jgi:hypothetical protein
MQLHANAKLGLAGRYELVFAIEGGLTLKAGAPRSASRRRRRTAGGTAGSRARSVRGERSPIARVAPGARRGGSLRPGRSRSCALGARLDSGPRGWPGSSCFWGQVLQCDIPARCGGARPDPSLVTYPPGREMCEAYLAGNPERFLRLLTE